VRNHSEKLVTNFACKLCRYTVVEIHPDTSLTNFKRSMDKLQQKLGVDIEISDHEGIHRHVK
jgi:hypothetical protein